MQQAAADIYLGEDQRLRVKGVLSFATVPQLRELGNFLIKTHFSAEFDLQEVTRVDSAALALLTSWTRFARQLGLRASFVNLPAQLLDLARLSNLGSILTVEAAMELGEAERKPSPLHIVES